MLPKDKDLNTDVRKRARVSTLIEKSNKRRKTGIQIDIFTLYPQLTSWYLGPGMAIKMKAAEEDEDEAEELRTPEAKLSAASEEREDEADHRKHQKRVLPKAKKGR
jgi:hypothetical protein